LDLLSSIIEKKKAQLNELDNLAQSLFYEMFGDPITNEKGWDSNVLENVVASDCSISYGIVQPGDDVFDGIPVVRPVDLVSNVVKREGLKRVAKNISDSYRRTILKGGEILLCVRGTTGVMSFASDSLAGCNVTRGITPLSFESKLNKEYVFAYLSSKYIKDIIADNTRGATLKQINMKDVRKLPVQIPPLDLQNQFAEKVQAIEHQKELIKQSIKEVETLFNSRMDYYFN
jgi:type I restriction enzyme S subunit